MTPDVPPFIPAPSPEAAPASPPPPERWTFRDLGIFIGFGTLAFVFAYIGVTIGTLPFLFRHGANRALSPEANAYISLVFMCVFYVLLFGAIYGLVALRGRRPLRRAIKWQLPPLGRALVFFAGGFVLSIAVELAPAIFPDQSHFPLQDLFTTPAVAYALGGFAVLIAPLMEELVFRGVLFAIFEDQLGLRVSIILTAVLFTAMHIPEYLGAWNHVFLLLIVGLVFSLARGITGSLVPSVLLHTAYNFSQIVILFFVTDHFRNMQGALFR